MEMDGPPTDDVCCICHERFKDPCQANCSHWFCGNCILSHWQHGFTIHPCSCPLCRRPITLLIPSVATQQSYDQEVNQMLDGIRRYNSQFGNRPNSFLQRFQDLPFLLLRLLREFRNPQTSLLSSFLQARLVFEVLFGLLYLVSPVDFLPERVVGLAGFIDDILLVVIVLIHIAATYRTVLLSHFSGRQYIGRQYIGRQSRQHIQ